MKKVKVQICTGTTCFVMGASNLQDIEEHLPEDIKPYVEISGAHCLGFCKDRNYGKAPFVMIDDEMHAGVNLPELLALIDSKVRG